MDYLIKQTSRVRFSGQQSIEGPGSIRERRTPPLQKTPSFKEEKKRPQNWFRRQISRQMNQDYDSNIGIEQATAVAAAAYAISSLKESSNIPEQKKISQGPDSSFARIKSRKEGTTTTVSGPEQKKISEGPDPSLARTKSRKENTTATTISSSELGEDTRRSPEIPVEKKPVKVVEPAPSMKKTPTFTDKPAIQMEKVPTFAEEQLRRTDEIQPEKPAIKPEMRMPKPELPATRPEIGGGTEADIWERTVLARIKKKYEELNARIISWENNKKAKSRRRLDKTESELERKRLKAFEQFHSEVDDINKIAAGARSKAKERQRKEELKAKEKANQIRKTGKVPSTCSCF